MFFFAGTKACTNHAGKNEREKTENNTSELKYVYVIEKSCWQSATLNRRRLICCETRYMLNRFREAY